MVILLEVVKVGEGASWRKLSLGRALERCSLPSDPLSLPVHCEVDGGPSHSPLQGKLKHHGLRNSKPKVHGWRHWKATLEKCFPFFKCFLSGNCESDKKPTTTDTLSFLSAFCSEDICKPGSQPSSRTGPTGSFSWTSFLQLWSKCFQLKPFVSNTWTDWASFLPGVLTPFPLYSNSAAQTIYFGSSRDASKPSTSVESVLGSWIHIFTYRSLNPHICAVPKTSYIYSLWDQGTQILK